MPPPEGCGRPRHEFTTAPISTTVTWNPAAIDGLNRLIDSGRVEPAWCTTWNDEANVLAQVLGLHGAPWRVLTARGHNDPRDPTGWFKSRAIAAASADA